MQIHTCLFTINFIFQSTFTLNWTWNFLVVGILSLLILSNVKSPPSVVFYSCPYSYYLCFLSVSTRLFSHHSNLSIQPRSNNSHNYYSGLIDQNYIFSYTPYKSEHPYNSLSRTVVIHFTWRPSSRN